MTITFKYSVFYCYVMTYYQRHREERIAYAKNYNRTHSEQRKRLRKTYKEYDKKYRETHRELYKKSDKKYYDTHKTLCLERTKKWCETHKKRKSEIQLKCIHKRKRHLGFNVIWQPQVIIEPVEHHHINKEDMIIIPSRIHGSISHDVWSGRNMEQINELAFEYAHLIGFLT